MMTNELRVFIHIYSIFCLENSHGEAGIPDPCLGQVHRRLEVISRSENRPGMDDSRFEDPSPIPPVVISKYKGHTLG